MDFQTGIDIFFDEYERRFNESLTSSSVDVDGVVNSFASCFIEAGPNGVICGKNDEQFRTMIPQGFAYYKSIGNRQMRIRRKDVTFLDEQHALVRVYWRSEYIKTGDEIIIIDFHVFYILYNAEDGIKIFAYITGDEQKALKEHGVIS